MSALLPSCMEIKPSYFEKRSFSSCSVIVEGNLLTNSLGEAGLPCLSSMGSLSCSLPRFTPLFCSNIPQACTLSFPLACMLCTALLAAPPGCEALHVRGCVRACVGAACFFRVRAACGVLFSRSESDPGRHSAGARPHKTPASRTAALTETFHLKHT